MLLAQVFGTSILDIGDSKLRSVFVGRDTQDGRARPGEQPTLPAHGEPPFIPLLVTMDHYLANLLYGNWEAHFFHKEFVGGEVQAGACEMDDFSSPPPESALCFPWPGPGPPPMCASAPHIEL